jgi:phage gp46-like protein
MGDIRIVWDPPTGTGDLNMLASGALETGNDLQTASLISMFTDAQADPGDIVYGTDPAGVWIDTYAALEDPALPTIAKDRMGSKIWQAFARPRTQETLNWLRDEIIRCHSWMITDGVASAVGANTFFIGPGRIGANVTITASGVANLFYYVWAQES